jgi:hypothetical protein
MTTLTSDTVTEPPRRRLQDWVPVDAITSDARQAKPGRALLALVGGLIFGVFWLAGKAFGVLFLSGAWCVSAAKMGWRQARGIPLSQPSLEQVLAENAQLRAELSRVS